MQRLNIGLFAVALVATSWSAACGSAPLGNDRYPSRAPDGSSADPDTSAPGDAGTTPDSGHEDPSRPDASGCGEVGHGTSSQIESTPRADTNLELLALTLTDEVVASQKDYDRITRDVEKLRGENDQIADIGYFAPHDGKTIIVKADDDQTRDAIENGTYSEWDCLNDHYGKREIDDLLEQSFTLELKGIYDLSLVASDYDALPSLEYAETNGHIGDGSTICVAREGETYRYVFDKAWGDCPSGCINHHYWYYAVEADGTITDSDAWEQNHDEDAPDWLEVCGR